MPQPAIDFYAILQLLSGANVKYVVIGGVAMKMHGANNLTVDMDISFSRDRENANALAIALSTQNARLRGIPADLPCIVDAHVLRSTTNLTLETVIGDFDLLAEPAGVDSFEGLWNRAVVMDVDGIKVHVSSIDDLIAMKRVADRPKDREHILELEALKATKGS